jgi:hypothetical protein
MGLSSSSSWAWSSTILNMYFYVYIIEYHKTAIEKYRKKTNNENVARNKIRES